MNKLNIKINMKTDIEKTKSFEEKMMDRIRESIGDLMTDEDLKKILEKGIEKALFQERSVEGRYSTTKNPSIVDECITKFLQTRMNEEVGKWIKENPEKIEAAIQHTMQMGVAKCVDYALENKFNYVFQGMLKWHEQEKHTN